MSESLNCSYPICQNQPNVYCNCSQNPSYLCQQHINTHIKSNPSAQHHFVRIFPPQNFNNLPIKNNLNQVQDKIAPILIQMFSLKQELQNQLLDINKIYEEQIQKIEEDLGPIEEELELALIKNHFSMFTHSSFIQQIVLNPYSSIQNILEEILPSNTSAIEILNSISNIPLQDRLTIKDRNLSGNILNIHRIASYLSSQDQNSLLKVVKASRKDFSSNWASSNAATLLNYSNFSFNDLNLSNIKIRGADLRNAQFQKTNLEKSDLRETNLTDANLTNASLKQSNLQGVNISIFPQQHFSLISSMKYSKDEKYLVTGGGDCQVNLWNIQQKQLVHSFRNHTDWIQNVDICIKRGLIASGSWDLSARVWKIDSKQEYRNFKVSCGMCYCIRFSPSGQHLAIGGLKRIYIIHIDQSQILNTIELQIDVFWNFDYLGTDKFLASGSYYPYFKVWSIQNASIIVQQQLQSSIQIFKYFDLRKEVACGLKNGDIALFCTNSMSIKINWSACVSQIIDLDYSSCGYWLVCLQKQQIRIWQLQTLSCSQIIQNPNFKYTSIACSPISLHFAIGSNNGFITFFQIPTGQYSFQFFPSKNKIISVCISNCGNFLACSHLSSKIIVWEQKSSKKIAILKNQVEIQIKLCFSPDSRFIASIKPFQFGVNVWDWKIQNLYFCFYAIGIVKAINFSPKDNKILYCGDGNTIKMWNLKSKKEVFQLKEHSSNVQALQFHPEGILMASYFQDKTVKLWNLQSKSQVWTYQEASSIMNCVKFSLDGVYLGYYTGSQTIKLWRLQDFSLFKVFQIKDPSYSGFDFSICGKYLLFDDGIKNLLVKSIEDQNQTKIIKMKNRIVEIIIVSPKGRFVYTLDGQSIYKWNLFQSQENNIEQLQFVYTEGFFSAINLNYQEILADINIQKILQTFSRK